MGSIVERTALAAPPERVWPLLADVRRLPELSASTEAVLDAPERISEPGQTFRQVVRAVGRSFESVWRVLEVEPERRLVIEGSVGFGVTYRLTEALEPMGDASSELTVTIEYRLPLGPFGRVAARLGVERLAREEAATVVGGIARVVAEGVGPPGA